MTFRPEPLATPQLPAHRSLTVVAVLGVLLFALWGIGTPLLGTGSLTATNQLTTSSPYQETGLNTGSTNYQLADTITSELPETILFRQSLLDGHGTGWDPYGAGGSALGAVPNNALYSPLTATYYLLPTWLAPAYERLLEIIVSAGACYLFLRRLTLSRPSAVTGGLVFASSAFMIVWLGFPQTRTAAFIPALFWALERFLQERRLRDAALISVPVACMLLGGFPSVTGFALLTAGAYVAVRLLAERPRELRRLLLSGVGAAVGVGAGFALAMFQLVGFLDFFSTWLVEGRAQDSGSHLAATDLLTSFSPWLFGTVNTLKPPAFILPPNLIEAMSYLGAGAVVLVLVAVALPRRARAVLPRATGIFFALATGVWLELIYLGGPPLALAQKLPGLSALFAQNYIGRGRSVLGLLLAVLAAVGFDLLLRRRAALPALSGPHWWRRLHRAHAWPIALGVAILVAGVLLLLRAGDYVQQAQEAGAGSNFVHQLLVGAALLAAAGFCAAVLLLLADPRVLAARPRPRRALRLLAAACLPVLIAVQSASFAAAYWPHSSRTQFYPMTETHTYLADNLGEQRYASTMSAMVFGTSSAYDLRSVNGHAFINNQFATLIQAIPQNPNYFETYIDFLDENDNAQAESPILDLLGTRYFVTSLTQPPLGNQVEAPRDATTQTIRPGIPVTVPLQGSGSLRGIGLTPSGHVAAGLTDPSNKISFVVKDATGAVVAQTTESTATLWSGHQFPVPLAADDQAPGTKLTTTITLDATEPLTVAADHGQAALDTVTDADDGLRLAHVGTSAIYQRLNAQPRIRWASTSTVVTDQTARVNLLASGSVTSDQVVLSAPGPAASGRPGTVTVDDDGTDSVSTTVNAQGAGYLVVADADQAGWAASVDGKPTALVAADQGLVAVDVPAGHHTVSLRLAVPHATSALVLSASTAGLMLVAVVGEFCWLRRRRAGTAPPGAGTAQGQGPPTERAQVSR
ncbi:YfhO family protein [Streptacidiphilus sp. EB129]|uniref:YfhO family protein n=1 Tax=Streptacidiphilus sp. EB129 TaxID=3156262 RepID=UPI0035143BA9